MSKTQRCAWSSCSGTWILLAIGQLCAHKLGMCLFFCISTSKLLIPREPSNLSVNYTAFSLGHHCFIWKELSPNPTVPMAHTLSLQHLLLAFCPLFQCFCKLYVMERSQQSLCYSFPRWQWLSLAVFLFFAVNNNWDFLRFVTLIPISPKRWSSWLTFSGVSTPNSLSIPGLEFHCLYKLLTVYNSLCVLTFIS